jgi:hypothetical protein
MWRYGTRAASRPTARRAQERGVALIVAMVVLALTAAIGLGLVLTTSLEPLTAANYESSWAAFFAAEAGIAVAGHELAAIADWNAVLTGQVGSGVLDRPGPVLALPDGSSASLSDLTNLATCGHAEPCASAELAAFTVERPWGPNNPRWQVFGHGRLDQLLPGGSGVPVEVVVWVADDPGDTDGDPLRDSDAALGEEWRPGACVVAVRAEAFAARSGHRAITATFSRESPGCGTGARLVSWHELK